MDVRSNQEKVRGRSGRAPAAAKALGISIATLWRWNRLRHDMPKGIQLSARVTVWDLDQLLEWRDAQAGKGAA